MDIAVALGGGGARGFAHIGVLRVLEREGFRIRAIAGTSMGGVIASVYAAGYSPDEIEQRAARMPLTDLLKSRPRGPAIFGLARIEAFLREQLGERTFADLRCPLALTATDLGESKEVVLTDGVVVDAVLATIALPGIFPPKLLGEQRLLDGGVVDPVPVRPARSLFAGPVVAVALSPPPERWASSRSPVSLGIPFLGVVTRLRVAEALTVVLRAIEITTRSMTELRLEADRPEVVIRPAVAHIGLLEAASVTEIAALGERAAVDALPQLKRLASPTGRMRRWFRRRLGA